MVSCPTQSRLSPRSGAQVITGSSPSLPLGERGLPWPTGPLPLFLGQWGRSVCEPGSQPNWEKIKSPSVAQQLTAFLSALSACAPAP